MKRKIISFLCIGLIAMILLPLNVDAKNITALDASGNNNKITVSGTTEEGVLAIAVLVYSGDDLSHMETCAAINNKYSCKLSKKFNAGTYTVKVADYDGGDYMSKDVTVTNAVNSNDNPQTGDNLVLYIILGSVSAIGLLGTGYYLIKKRYN